MTARKLKTLDRLKSYCKASDHERPNLMNPIQRIHYKSKIRFLRDLLTLYNEHPDVLESDEVLSLVIESFSRYKSLCGGGRYITYRNPPRFKPMNNFIRNAQNAEERFAKNFRDYFTFNNAQHLMEVAYCLELSASSATTDTGYHLQISAKDSVPATLGLMIYLARMKKVFNNLEKLGRLFGYSKSKTSRVIQAISKAIYERFSKNLGIEYVAKIQDKLPEYRDSIRRRFIDRYKLKYDHYPIRIPPEIEKTALVLDGTFIEICRPSMKKGDIQRYVYNGRENAHGLIFIGVIAPDGLCWVLEGPAAGANNDVGVIRDFNFHHYFGAVLQDFKVLGDSIFHDTNNIVHMPDSAELEDRDKQEVNAIGSVRAEIEHFFKDLKQKFKYLNQKEVHKMNSSVGIHVKNCAFFCNLLTCLYGNQTVSVFKKQPPTLSDYCRTMKFEVND